MWPFNTEPVDFWDDKYIPLATFNAEVNRGIVHTKDYDDKMADLQEEYYAKQQAHNRKYGLIVL